MAVMSAAARIVILVALSAGAPASGARAQADFAGKTLVAVGTVDKGVRGDVKYGGNKKAAESIGRLIAEKALAAGITQVKFDRGNYKYHGRVAALADAARKAGLEF